MAGATAQWSSRFGFLMASVGFAVGLGNIWRFPYVTGENGGSAFVLIYLLCAFGIGVPIMMAEILIGRRGGGSPPRSLANLAPGAPGWAGVGYLNLLTSFTILMAYTVVAGWVLSYLVLAMTGGLGVLVDAAATVAHFDVLLASVPRLALWTGVAIMLAGAIVFAGLEKGIERAVKVMMPLLFVLLAGLALFNVFAGGMDQALAYLFTPDFSRVTPGVFLAAVGQAFFSIGVAMAGMMMFGAYLPRDVSIASSAFIIVTVDTLVALLAGLVIFPLVFHNGLDPASGTGLIFKTLPLAFASMPSGEVFAVLFFLLLSVAAITSIVGFMEPLAAWLAERFAWSRQRAAGALLLLLAVFSFVSVLSYNHWSAISLFGANLGSIIDYVPNQIFLPVGGLLIAIFAGWVMRAQDTADELALTGGQFATWRLLLRYAVIPAVVVIFVSGLFA